ncbi:hypothetical protein SAMN05421664_3301 [Chryseobacterium soldanellicola]|uniref:Right handed beta helix region n=1 Tax=Chryseobacterium soldanellicola TaxID=311333 RepID=A0A1H1FWZ2_9FLAO|nr:hypothetical protein [Chryseobacterium soldanellicola]SDR05198.1 hypothetical protein SAMN05421664_3301 [Chryseobacterium soldanellicola]
MSNTLDLLETNDFPTQGITDSFVTLIDSQTKELVNFVKLSPTPIPSPTIDGVMYLQENTTNQVYKRVYNGVINPEWFGSGKTDAELQTAINAAVDNDTIIIRGLYRCAHQIIINKPLTLLGQNYINGNDTGYENSRIYFGDFEDTLATACIESNNNLNIKNLVVVGSNIEGKIGLKLNNVSLTLDSVTIQSFETGVEVTGGYYNKFVNSAIVYCPTCLVLNNCYNTNATSLSVSAGYESGDTNTKGIVLNDGSNLNMFGGSIEGFSESGINLSASRASFYGTYFEGIYDEVNINSCITVEDDHCRVNAVNCHVYLAFGKANTFVYIPSTVTSAHIHSKNNYFEYEPVSDWYTSVYRFAATDFTSYSIDISGDNYKNDLVNTGSSYISITSALLEKGNGIVQLIYPSGHELAGIHLTNLNTISPYQYNDDILKLQNGTITTFRNNGGLDDDPLHLHFGSYGYNPYTVIMENGEWKKIPN